VYDSPLVHVLHRLKYLSQYWLCFALLKRSISIHHCVKDLFSSYLFHDNVSPAFKLLWNVFYSSHNVLVTIELLHDEVFLLSMQVHFFIVAPEYLDSAYFPSCSVFAFPDNSMRSLNLEAKLRGNIFIAHFPKQFSLFIHLVLFQKGALIRS
jgi:hypothetical protein